MSNGEKIAKSHTFTTGQISGITRIGRQSLYRYVRDFPDFFSQTVRQHKQGRRWTQDDLNMIEAIRCLYHERTGEQRIKEIIKGGWRLADNQAWTRELQSRLIEMTFAANAEADEISKQAIDAINDLQIKTLVAEGNNKEFAALWILVKDIQAEWRELESELRITGRIRRKSNIKKWYGEPPVLYLAPVGTLNKYKPEDIDAPSSKKS